jgi:outer membrane protein assembly factor BamB
MHDLVIVSTNAKTALAYDALSGKLVWKQKLDGPSTFGPIVHQDSVLVLSDSLYVLNPRTGSVRRRLFWSDSKVQQAASTPQEHHCHASPRHNPTQRFPLRMQRQ